MKKNLSKEKTREKKSPDEIYVQRFEFLMKLIRINMMLRKAKIIYPK